MLDLNQQMKIHKNVKSLAAKLKQRLFYRPYFGTKDVEIGRNVSFGKNVCFNCQRVRIGDGVIFGDDVRIDSDVFEIGDYGTIYRHCFFPGPGKLLIGHNFWLGTGAIVDSMGGTYIGNNVCVGPYSQLWTHMIFGDVMYGCRFHSIKSLTIEDDAWLSGQCLVSPVRIGARSLAMLGSLITKDMEPDRTYAGTPAHDITERVGSQFRLTSIEERTVYLQRHLEEFGQVNGITNMVDLVRIVSDSNQMANVPKGVIAFNIADRKYTKGGSIIEHKLIRFLLPSAKFIPSA